MHELATNSVKYGALSVDSGKLDISGSLVGDDVQIDWAEHGGPEVIVPQSSDSYGSKLIRQTIGSQFAGTISHDWSRNGLIVTIVINSKRLSG